MGTFTDKLRSLVGGKAGRGAEDESRLAHQKIREKNKRLKELRQRLEAKDRELAELRAKLGADGTGIETAGIKPENIIWIFCVGRSGSTWLASMMGDLEGHARWNEPYVGALFGELYYERFPHKRSKGSIMGDPFKDLWLRQIRRMVLEGAQARYPGLDSDGYVVIKEPHGSVGAPLMMEALPESRMILLVRDPRDVATVRSKKAGPLEPLGGAKRANQRRLRTRIRTGSSRAVRRFISEAWAKPRKLMMHTRGTRCWYATRS